MPSSPLQMVSRPRPPAEYLQLLSLVVARTIATLLLQRTFRGFRCCLLVSDILGTELPLRPDCCPHGISRDGMSRGLSKTQQALAARFHRVAGSFGPAASRPSRR